MDVDSKLVSKNLKRLCKERHIRQYELADMCGYHRNTFNKYFLGTASPRVDVLIDIATVLKVDVTEFFV